MINYSDFNSLEFIDSMRESDDYKIREIIELFDILCDEEEASVDVYDKANEVLRIVSANCSDPNIPFELESVIEDYFSSSFDMETAIFVFGKICYLIENDYVMKFEKSFDELEMPSSYSEYRRQSEYLIGFSSLEEERDSISLARYRDDTDKERAAEAAYREVVRYIKSLKVPFKKSELANHFSFYSYNLINKVMKSEEYIVRFSNSYIWYENLNVDENDEEYLRIIVSSICMDEKSHHMNEVYEYISKDYPSLLKSYMCTTPYRLFAILKVICKETQKFDSPFLANKTVKIESAEERLRNYVTDKSHVAIRDLLDFAKENYLTFGSVFSMIDCLEKTHIFVSHSELVSVRELDINKDKLKQIEEIIYQELRSKRVMAISSLTNADQLPAIGEKWNEWLIYGILKKYNASFTVTITSNRYKYGIPVISTYGSVSERKLEELEKEFRDNTLRVADNMDDIDLLLEDIGEEIFFDD